MVWWSRRSGPVEQGRTPDARPAVASQVIRESRRYSRGVQSLVLRATLLTAGLLAYLWLASVLFGTQSAEESTKIFEVHRLSGASIVGIYAGLGGIVVALQFGARSVLAAESADVRATARSIVQRNFLRALTIGALFASIALGCMCAIWYARFPNFDATRVGGTMLASLFLAFVAAETHLLLENPVGDQVRALLQRRRRGQLRHVVDNAFPTRRNLSAAWAERMLAFVVVPVLCTFASDVALPTRNTVTLLGRLGIIMLVSITAWVIVLFFVTALLDRQPGVLFFTVAIGCLLAGELVIAVLQAQLAYHGKDLTVGDLGRGLLGMWICVAVVPVAVMTIATWRSKERAGFIVEDARRLLTRRLVRLERQSQRRRSRVQLGRLVLWSWAAVPFFPFGVLLGRRAAREARAFGHRGARAADAAAVTCAALTALGTGVIVVAACLP